MNSRILYVVLVSFFSHIYGCQSPNPQYLAFLAQQFQASEQNKTETIKKKAAVATQTFKPIQLPEASASSSSSLLHQAPSGSDTPVSNPARCP